MAADRVLEAIRLAAFREVEILKAAGVDARAINLTAFVSVSQGNVSVSTTPPPDDDTPIFVEADLKAIGIKLSSEVEPEEPAPAKSIRRKPAKK